MPCRLAGRFRSTGTVLPLCEAKKTAAAACGESVFMVASVQSSGRFRAKQQQLKKTHENYREITKQTHRNNKSKKTTSSVFVHFAGR